MSLKSFKKGLHCSTIEFTQQEKSTYKALNKKGRKHWMKIKWVEYEPTSLWLSFWNRYKSFKRFTYICQILIEGK